MFNSTQSRGLGLWLRLAVYVLILASLGLCAETAFASPTGGSIRLSDAAEQGAFNVGAAEARAVPNSSTDPTLEFATLQYAMPPGTAAGLWAKSFPAGLAAKNIDLVRAEIRPETPGAVEQIALALELKGTSGVQRISLDRSRSGDAIEESVDWNAIGAINEVVVLVSHAGSGETAAGTVHLDIRFDKLPLHRKLSTLVAGRIGGVFLFGLFAALASLPLQSWRARQRLLAAPYRISAGRFMKRFQAAWLLGLKRDFVLATAGVAIAGMAVVVYAIGGQGRLEIGWTAICVAALGAAVAGWLKIGLTGRHLTAREIIQNVVASGLPAASSSAMAILQTPAAWSEVLMLSPMVAAAVTVLYHAANAMRLASSGKHLSAVAAAAIVGAPYAVGSLLLVAAGPLLVSAGQTLLGGVWTVPPAVLETLGRVLVVLSFNEAVAVAIGLLTKRALPKGLRIHLVFLGVAMAVVAAPWIAAMGSSPTVAAWTTAPRVAGILLATMLSQAGLWAQVYLITGMALDGLRGKAPSASRAGAHPVSGMKKGMIFSGMFMGILLSIDLLRQSPLVGLAIGAQPLLLAATFGALCFPLVKTIVESFDGSEAFFRRAAASYSRPTLYLRGALVGLGLGWAATHAMAGQSMAERAAFGLAIGIAAFAGVSLLRDSAYAAAGRGRVQPLRAYVLEACLGGFIGAAIGFYLDAAQVSVVIEKFHRYVSLGHSPEAYTVYPLLSKWGFLHLGFVTGGASLLFAEALAGVISWSIPAWLFAINRTFMTAYFQREAAPIRALFTRAGLIQLTQNMIEVLRWGLWMSPIISSFLRPVGEPTWYNQDGAVRTGIAIFQDATLSREAFQAWSLKVFTWLLAYDLVRVLIWVDHMGLRVATLVNLSFLGMDRLDQRLARFLGPAAATGRCIPEAVKRFTTWAPLLIPFYIPRGQNWDIAWTQSEALQAAQGGGLVAWLSALSLPGQMLLFGAAVLGSTTVLSAVRLIRHRRRPQDAKPMSLAGAEYEVVLKSNGEIFSRAPERGYDVTRRSYDLLDPAGRTLFLVDLEQDEEAVARAWPVIGNFPRSHGPVPEIEQEGDRLRISTTRNGIRTTIEIALADERDSAELWTVTLENLGGEERTLKAAPYLEWVLNRPDADRGHTQYNRLFAEMQYAAGLQGVLAWDKHSKALGFIASDAAPEGFLTSRIDFIGRARSLWMPRVLETLAFQDARDTASHPTFDPIASLLVDATLPARGTRQLRFLIGMTKTKRAAIDLVARHLDLPGAETVSTARTPKASHPIGHGEIPPGTPQPYFTFSESGRTMRVHTPFTPRPFDQTLSNRLGQVTVVTNRGLHTTASWNSQQNRLTPDWPDIVTREVPGEAFYLYDPGSGQWYSPTYHPVNDASARHEVEFSVDGSAVYRMTQGDLATELTVFVPPEEPLSVYLLTVRNRSDKPRRLRLAPYFQMVMANQPEHSGPLKKRIDRTLDAVFFENPRNSYRTGPAFVAMSQSAEVVETQRGRFFGEAGDVARPQLVERGEPASATSGDDRPVAAMLTTLEIPAGGEQTVAVILGQADDATLAEELIRKYRNPEAACESLRNTRRWWTRRMDAVRVKTSNPAFDRYLDWLKYQALAERIWARRGFYQASGAYGFRDQLQDSVNLMWMDPAIARRQILLHASQQFLEGDVVHWFHLLQDGRTGFAARTHASDNLLWLAWAVAEYVGATGDQSILDERTAYLAAEQPFEPLPAGKHGMGFDPLRSSQTDTVYRHAMKAIDLVLEKRLGKHGLPLIGTGDWNDGLDEIGSQGRGESVWLGFFLYYIVDRMTGTIERREGAAKKDHYLTRLAQLRDALEGTWRGDRYLRAIHDDGTEIGVKDSGVWEIDALTAAWAVMSGINPQRGRVVFQTALRVLEKEKTILLGWPALREDTKPYLGRSSGYPEGVRENGMYCHGVQWLVGAARILAEQCQREGDSHGAQCYRDTAYRLWMKVSPIPHATPEEIETYGGQPNKQAADMLTTFDPGRMIWNGYTGAAGWLFRQALEGVLGARFSAGERLPPDDFGPAHNSLDTLFVYDYHGEGCAEAITPDSSPEA